ncbi:rhomboid family intramembrane serine protease [Aliiroseovarius subalbicans]|uniref:rhomboid family intramembrane serine protease n=1 Tax=Aliiroseovarius subalbicans TaxID=2925840 RepID=UPI001F567F63|nr:rhomboid family intramembrane serine protease [Aliiroseovarius subalbicans]MCI2399034.1 rhomboid family intramembrane serine protease [Aliiroseovarius subalbicans]
MFPLRDHNPSERTPYVTYALLVANIGIFLAMWPMMGDERVLGQFYFDWGLVGYKVLHGDGLSGFVTSMFLHGGWLHLAGNMLFLWIFGDNMEDELGHVGFAIFYLVSGIGAAILQILPDPETMVPMIGASGAIAGVMGGYLLLFPRARVDVLFIFIVFFKIFPVPAWVMLALWFGLQVFNGAASLGAEGGVAYWAHAGGFIVGFLWVLPKWLREGGPDFWRRTRGHPDHPEMRWKLAQSPIPKVRRPK